MHINIYLFIYLQYNSFYYYLQSIHPQQPATTDTSPSETTTSRTTKWCLGRWTGAAQSTRTVSFRDMPCHSDQCQEQKTPQPCRRWIQMSTYASPIDWSAKPSGCGWDLDFRWHFIQTSSQVSWAASCCTCQPLSPQALRSPTHLSIHPHLQRGCNWMQWVPGALQTGQHTNSKTKTRQNRHEHLDI